LPRPSKLFGFRPRKSLHARQRDRDQTVEELVHAVLAQRDLAPIGMPSRSLKVAIDLRALVTTGFWPAIARQIGSQRVDLLGVGDASPTPMLSTTLSRRGICISLV
jgi:hypothetical protein